MVISGVTKQRRHHNNKGYRQVKGGKTTEQVKSMCRRLGLTYSDTPIEGLTSSCSNRIRAAILSNKKRQRLEGRLFGLYDILSIRLINNSTGVLNVVNTRTEKCLAITFDYRYTHDVSHSSSDIDYEAFEIYSNDGELCDLLVSAFFSQIADEIYSRS